MAEIKPMSPDIALFHILPRLPAKSVCRFKCVSKEWHSFIRAPGFPKMHLHHQNHQKLLFLPHNKPWDFFTIDCETPEDGCTAIRPFPFKVGNCQEISIAASLHGMVCVLLNNKCGYDHPIKVTDILLWNPVTGEHKTLSKAGCHRDCYETNEHQYGLYYISSEDDYKIVCVTDNHHPVDVYIYSLKSDSWRKVESPGWCPLRYSFLMVKSVLLNEKLYFLYSSSVITFDTLTEKLRDIKTPYLENQKTCCMGIIIEGDCIYFILAIKNSEGRYNRTQWRMDGDGDWTKVESSFSNEQLYRSAETQHLMRNGNWLMYSSKEEHVYVLDAKKHTKQIMCSIKYAFRPEGRFIETFVSPNQYLK